MHEVVFVQVLDEIHHLHDEARDVRLGHLTESQKVLELFSSYVLVNQVVELLVLVKLMANEEILMFLRIGLKNTIFSSASLLKRA